MAITLVGTPQVGSSGNGGDVTLTFNVAPQENDVVILIGGHSDNGSSSTAVGPITSGYTEINLQQDLDQGVGAWYKVMGPTPDSTVQGEGGGYAGAGVVYGCYVLRGVDTGNVLDTTATAAGPTSGSQPNGPSITTVTDGAWVLTIIGLDGQGFGTPYDTPPSGYSNDIGAEIGETHNWSAGAATKEVASAGAEDPGAWSNWNTIAWYAITVAVRPASGGTTHNATPALFNLQPVQAAFAQAFQGGPASITFSPQAAIYLQSVAASPAQWIASPVGATFIIGSVHNATPALAQFSAVQGTFVQQVPASPVALVLTPVGAAYAQIVQVSPAVWTLTPIAATFPSIDLTVNIITIPAGRLGSDIAIPAGRLGSDINIPTGLI